MRANPGHARMEPHAIKWDDVILANALKITTDRTAKVSLSLKTK